MSEAAAPDNGDIVKAITLVLWENLAREIGAPAVVSRRMLSGERKISAGELASISTLLGTSPSDLLARAGRSDDE